MTILGKSEYIRGSVAVLSADNLGSNACGGFKEGGTAYRFCRQCLATEEESSELFKVCYNFSDDHHASFSLMKIISPCEIITPI